MPVEQFDSEMGRDRHSSRLRTQRTYELWKEQSQKTIDKIRSISGDIQILESNIKKRNILCSLIYIFSGVIAIDGIVGAPLTFFNGWLDTTAIGTGIGIYIGVHGIVSNLIKSSEIQSKLNEASTLLEVSSVRGKASVDLVMKLYMVQEQFCRAKKINRLLFSVLGIAVCKGGEALVDWIVLSFMFRSEGTNVCDKVGINSCEHVVAPMAGNAASEIAKKYLRVIGTAAVGIGIILEIVEIIQSVNALELKKLSDVVATLERVADELQDAVTNIDQIVDSVQNSDLPLSTYLANWFDRLKSLFVS